MLNTSGGSRELRGGCTTEVLSVLLLCCALSSASSATFYVSSLSGSDSFSGTSPSKPWASLAAAGERLSALGADATLLLSRDAVWLNDPLTITLKGSAVVVGAYGNQSLPRPLLQHARALNEEATACVELHSRTASVSGLHLSGCSRGLVLAGGTSSAAPAADVVVDSTLFTDIRTPFLRYTPPNPAWAPAILLDSGYFFNLTVRHCVGVRIDVFFDSTATVDTMLLDSNTVQQCSGNCYSLGSGVGLTMRNSVLLRDVSTRLFMYGTTDVIVGGLSGTNALIDNDFNQRGEYQGGPDGCAFDFETSATGFLVQGNTFSQSWGAGIMIFGHETTSHNITFTDNMFDRCGCVQNRGDKGAIAVMCPNKQKPSGQLYNNTFFTLPGCPAINPAFAGCADGLTQVGTQVYDYHDSSAQLLVEMPQVSFNPPAPSDTDTSGVFNVIAVTSTNGAVIRYTLDGSRPTAASNVMPPQGLQLPWPVDPPAIPLRLR